MSRIFRRNPSKTQLSDAVSDALDTDATSNIADDSVTAGGTDGLTGPETSVAAAHGEFVDDDLAAVFGDTDSVPPHSYVDPDNTPPPAKAEVPLTASAAIDGLAKQYVLKGFESLQRTPSPNLSDAYRAQLLHLRSMVNQVHKAGVRGIGRLTATIVGVLAVDQRGKIDAISFLRQIMRQAVWQASVDIARYRAAEAKGTRRIGEDEDRDAPYGMQGMSDHSDAIAGVRGSSEAVEVNEADAIAALVEVNGFLSAFADTLCDDENDRLYLGLEDGLSYIDKPGLMAGSWVGVYDVEEAIDIQLVKNQEGLAKRDADRAERRRAQLASLAAVLDGN